MTRVLVSADNPGGANAILPVAVALRDSGDMLLCVLAGSAREVFSREGLEYVDASVVPKEEIFNSIDAFSPDLLLTGTSQGYSVDKDLLLYTRERIPSVCVLDFWNGYMSRFSREGNDLAYLPSLVCVMDEAARSDMVAEGIPQDRILVTGNPYFEHFAECVTRENEDPRLILFISQPVSELSHPENGTPYGFDEFATLSGLIRASESLPADYRIQVRLHPRDDRNKYDALLSERVTLSDEPTVEKDLSHAGLIIGMFSPVLIQAAIAGKRVIRFQPGMLQDAMPASLGSSFAHAEDTQELTRLLTAYADGSLTLPEIAPQWQKSGATARVIEQVRKLL